MTVPLFQKGNPGNPHGRRGNNGVEARRTQAKTEAAREAELKLELAASEAAQKRIAEMGDVSREELVRRNVGWLALIAQRACDSGEYKAAVQALKELNTMRNLYVLATGGDDALQKSLAHVDDEGLGDVMLREVQMLLEKRNVTRSEAIQ